MTSVLHGPPSATLFQLSVLIDVVSMFEVKFYETFLLNITNSSSSEMIC